MDSGNQSIFVDINEHIVEYCFDS